MPIKCPDNEKFASKIICTEISLFTTYHTIVALKGLSTRAIR